MEWQDWWRIARRRWWLALLPPLVAVALILLPAVSDPPSAGFRVTLSYTAIPNRMT